MTLVEFVSARLDEDEAAAQAAASVAGPDWERDAQYLRSRSGAYLADAGSVDDDELAPFWSRHDPARVLREIEAKRAIIGEQTWDHAPVESMYGLSCRTCVAWQDAPLAEGGETEFGIAIPESWPCRVARAAVAGYAGHPHYDPAWALAAAQAPT